MFWVFVIISMFWGFFNLLKKLYDKRARKLINRAPNAERATQVRRRLLRIRTITLYLMFGFFVAGYLIFLIIEPEYALRGILIFAVVAVVIYVQVAYERSKRRLYGNISYITAEEYLKHDEDFYLYLRGFNSDMPFNSSAPVPKSRFDESLMAEALEYGLGAKMCALGMTKEIDCPEGAERLYVNDDDWQEHVLELMRRAQQIIILVNNRQSCLWEIEQAEAMKDKIVFVVDDRDNYNEVRKLYGELFDMPEPPQDSDKNFFFRCGAEAQIFDASLDGYLAIFNLSIAEVEEQQLEQRKALHRKRNVKEFKKIIINVVVTLIAILILFFIVSFLVHSCSV